MRPIFFLDATITEDAMPNRSLFIAAGILLQLTAPAVLAQPVSDGEPNRPDIRPAFAGQTEAPERVSSFVADPVLVAGGLEHPWAVAVLPDGAGFLVTERPGRLRHVTAKGSSPPRSAGVPEVFDVSQGGLSTSRLRRTSVTAA
jgi:glucose/arabinose dehydrogenase